MEDHPKPISPQAFLSYIEHLGPLQGRTVPMEIHVIMMAALARALAAANALDRTVQSVPQYILDIMSDELYRLGPVHTIAMHREGAQIW